MPEQKIVIISHDYDGCFSIMTPEGLEGELNGINRDYWEQWEQKGVDVRKRFESVILQHSNFLDKITKDAAEVRVYVGSDRQSDKIDLLNCIKHNNGSVFPALERLCITRGTSKQPWRFEPLLLADPKIEGRTPFLRRRGAAYREILECSETQLNVVEKPIYFEDHEGKTQKSKRPLLLNQMWDAYRQNHEAQLEFHFIDDRDDLIQDILTNLKPKDLPPNMTLIVSKFNYIQAVKKDPNAHKLCGTIEAKKHCADKYPYLTWGLYAATAAATMGVAAYSLASTPSK